MLFILSDWMSNRDFLVDWSGRRDKAFKPGLSRLKREGGVTEETNDTRKSIKQALTIYRDFMKNCFIRFWEEGQCKPLTTAALIFAGPQSNVISFLCSKDSWLSLRKWLFPGEEKKFSFPLEKCVGHSLKKLDLFQKTLRPMVSQGGYR